MYYSSMCGGGYCGGYDETLTGKDKKVVLEEKKAIYEAKLATLNHMIDSLEKEESKSDKD